MWSAGACSRSESLGRIALPFPLGARRKTASPFFLQHPAITSAILKETTRCREMIAVPFLDRARDPSPARCIRRLLRHRLPAANFGVGPHLIRCPVVKNPSRAKPCLGRGGPPWSAFDRTMRTGATDLFSSSWVASRCLGPVGPHKTTTMET
jgi:hypothetical protein